MKQYAITAKVYSAAGAPTNETIKREFDFPEDAENCFNELSNARQENGFRQYGEVKLNISARKEISNPADFFAQFKA